MNEKNNSYLTIQGIHIQKCTRCNACIKDCPQLLFHARDDGTVRFFDPLDQCIRCGHCIAVCPSDAVDFTAPEAAFTHPKISKPSSLFDRESLYAFIRARRSVRQYRKDSVDAETIHRVLDVMRHAPTASNKESIHYTVITDPEVLSQIRSRVINMFKFIKRMISVIRFFVPFGRRKKGILGNSLFRSLTETLKRVQAGYDPALFHAPCCIIISSPVYGNQSAVDAGIVLTHGMYAALAEGLGTCLIGFAHEMLVRSRRFCRTLHIPKKNRVQGVMVMGHSAVFYKKAPPRKPLSAEYFKPSRLPS